MPSTNEPTLVASCVMRKAKKRWRCCCADPVRRWEVRATWAGGWSGRTVRFDPEHPEDTAPDVLEAMAARRIGELATVSGERFTGAEVIPHRNPEHRDGALVDVCAGWIEPGDLYVEYLGESGPYQSGSRYCLPCGVAVWTPDGAR